MCQDLGTVFHLLGTVCQDLGTVLGTLLGTVQKRGPSGAILSEETRKKPIYWFFYLTVLDWLIVCFAFPPPLTVRHRRGSQS